MSFKATFDFILHLESFRNIDLFQQGLYYLKFSIYHEKNGKLIYAQPYNMIDGYQQRKEAQEKQNQDSNQPKKLKDKGPWAPTQINYDDCTFQTQTFLIRYVEEEIDLNDICFFKSEIDAYPSYDSEPFFIVCQLMCADLTTFGQQRKDDGEEDMFKCVATHKSQLNNVAMGIHEYMAITFDETHFCLAHASFHSTLMDFKYRLSDFQMQIMSESQQQKQNNNNKFQQPSAAILLQPQNFTEFMNIATKRYDRDMLNNFYDYYINGLRDEYTTMASFLSKIREKGISKMFKQKYPQVFEQEFPDLPEPIYLQNWKKSQRKNGGFVVETPLTENQNFVNTNYQTNQNNNQQKQQGNYKNNNNENIQKQISECYDLKNIRVRQQIADDIMQEMNILSGNLFQLQNILIEYIKVAPYAVIQFLGIQYHQLMKERWGEHIFRNQQKTTDITINTEPDAGKFHKKVANKMREQAKFQEHDEPQIENLNMFPKYDKQPILFEDISFKSEKTNFKGINSQYHKQKGNTEGFHIFILCHGFQGNSFDVRLIKNNLALIHPQALFLCSKSNEDYTDGDISDMGKRLSNEVKSFIKEQCQAQNLGRLSFVGHSMGGIIIRAALPYLQEYKDKMYTFLSLSSPHMGYMHNSSKVVDAGIWFLQKMRKSKALEQLSMSDSEEIQNTFLFNLARAPGLNWFENIGLVSSFQDSYVAFESARIQKFPQGTFDSKKGQLYQQMVDNLLGQVKSDKVHRIDVNFNIKDLNFDSAIGRTAHILFLESDSLCKMFVYCFDHLFK